MEKDDLKALAGLVFAVVLAYLAVTHLWVGAALH